MAQDIQSAAAREEAAKAFIVFAGKACISWLLLLVMLVQIYMKAIMEASEDLESKTTGWSGGRDVTYVFGVCCDMQGGSGLNVGVTRQLESGWRVEGWELRGFL